MNGSSPDPDSPQDSRARVAIDLGAGSCRVGLLRWREGTPAIEFIHRFANGPVEQAGGLRWDLEKICAGIDEGLRICAEQAPEGIASIGADGWAVDYVRLNDDGRPAAAPFCYRDTRNVAAEEAVHAIISPERLYALAGVQRLRFNTVYQLYADRIAGTPAAPWVNLPEYVLHRLGGRRVAEYTNATHTGLIDLGTRSWCAEIFSALDLDIHAAPQLVASGTDLGMLAGPLAALPSYRETRLIAPACHDTASAIAGIPAEGDDWAYISSGTWSLIGTVLDRPCTSAEARAQDFTNLGAAAGGICFHKSVNGMWLIQQSMEAWAAQGQPWTVADLIEQAERLTTPDRILDVDAPELLLPGDMPKRINKQLQQQGLAPIPESPEHAPEFASLIFYSLAARYAEKISAIQQVTGKQLRRLYIVGGGSQNDLLNRWTAEATGLDVHCCQVESATIGNFATQLAASEQTGHGPARTDVSRWARKLQVAI